MATKRGLRERVISVWRKHRLALLAVFWVVVVPLPLLIFMATYLPDHAEQSEWFGYPVPALAAASWLTFVVGQRLATRRDETTTPPNSREAPQVERLQIVGAALGFAAFVYVLLIEGRRHRGLADEFQDIRIGAAKGWGIALVVCGAIWLLCALLPASLAYARRRLTPGLVDALVDQGGPHAVRVLYRPTLGLGGVLRVRVKRGEEVLLGPGQAVGFLVAKGRCAIAISGGTGRKMSASLELVEGRATELTVCRGWWPRLAFRHTAAGVAFVVRPRAFVSLWTGAGSFEWPRGRRGTVELRASERDPRGSVARVVREARRGP